jgi:hypothetical protein
LAGFGHVTNSSIIVLKWGFSNISFSSTEYSEKKRHFSYRTVPTLWYYINL